MNAATSVVVGAVPDRFLRDAMKTLLRSRGAVASRMCAALLLGMVVVAASHTGVVPHAATDGFSGTANMQTLGMLGLLFSALGVAFAALVRPAGRLMPFFATLLRNACVLAYTAAGVILAEHAAHTLPDTDALFAGTSPLLSGLSWLLAPCLAAELFAAAVESFGENIRAGRYRTGERVSLFALGTALSAALLFPLFI